MLQPEWVRRARRGRLPPAVRLRRVQPRAARRAGGRAARARHAVRPHGPRPAQPAPRVARGPRRPARRAAAGRRRDRHADARAPRPRSLAAGAARRPSCRTRTSSSSTRRRGSAPEREREPRPGFRIGLHVKSLRASMDPLRLLPTLVETARSLPGAVLQVNAHRDVLEDDGARCDARLADLLRRHAEAGELELEVHDFLPDDDLWRYLASLDVSVLPYRFGTHSGWLEACRDLGTTVVAPSCGYFAEQGPVLGYTPRRDVLRPRQPGRGADPRLRGAPAVGRLAGGAPRSSARRSPTPTSASTGRWSREQTAADLPGRLEPVPGARAVRGRSRGAHPRPGPRARAPRARGLAVRRPRLRPAAAGHRAAGRRRSPPSAQARTDVGAHPRAVDGRAPRLPRPDAGPRPRRAPALRRRAQQLPAPPAGRDGRVADGADGDHRAHTAAGLAGVGGDRWRTARPPSPRSARTPPGRGRTSSTARSC